MSILKELQTAIDQKKIDTRTLSDVEKAVLDDSFKSGELQGYEGIEDYENLINLSAQSLAVGKEAQLRGAVSAGLPDRGNMVMYGAGAAAMVPYFKNQQALIDSFAKNGFQELYTILREFIFQKL